MPRVPAMRPASRAANVPFTLSSMATRSRSSPGQNPFFHVFFFQACFLIRCQCDTVQGPAQRRRHDYCSNHCHRDDHGVQILGEHTHRQADGCDDDLGRSACVHGAAERERLATRQASPIGAREGTGKFTDARNQNQYERNSRKVGSRKIVKSAVKPEIPKNTGMNSALVKAANCSPIFPVRMGIPQSRYPRQKRQAPYARR